MPVTCFRCGLISMPQKQVQQKETTAFGAWLKEARGLREFTSEALAIEAGVTQPMISNLENGKRNPSREMVTRLAGALLPTKVEENYPGEAHRLLLSAGLRAAGFLPLEGEDAGDSVPLEYGPILDAVRGASYKGVLDGDLIDEIAEDIRHKTDRRARKQGRA